MMDPEQLKAKLQKLAEAYLKDLPAKLDELSAAVHEVRDLVGEPLLRPQRMAHSLAGSGATFGLPNISVLARKMEHLLQAKREQSLPLDDDALTVIAEAIAEMRSECLPAIQAAPLPPVAPNTESISETSNGPVICVVDDDPIFADALCLQLSYFGFVPKYFNGPTALLQQGLPAGAQVILMDVDFPDELYTGPEAIQQPHAKALRELPVLFMSSRSGVLARLEAVRAGGKGYYVKPVDLTALVEQLDNLTGRVALPEYRVIIVEDSPNLANFYAQILSNAGMLTRVVTEPLKVFDQISEFMPDLLLTDMHMPVCTGLELAQLIRHQSNFVGLPIVFLSSERDPVLMRQAMASGADDFLIKPIDPDQLIASVRARADRHRLLRAQLIKDGLTGLVNHTRFKESLDVEITRARRHGTPLSLVMLDIDHFKRVNDSFGHPVGDQVLRALSRLLSQRLRRSDLAGRYGGEEFALFLPETNLDGALHVVNGIREGFAQLRHLAGVDSFSVTLSAGVVELAVSDTPASLLTRADQALYLAKRNGRNRVEVLPGMR